MWSAVGLPLSLVKPGCDRERDAECYDWILAADCDMMFVNMEVPLEKVLDEYVNDLTD